LEEGLDFNAQCDKIGILPEERIPYGRKIGKVDYLAIKEALSHPSLYRTARERRRRHAANVGTLLYERPPLRGPF
jgi:hypothetical protein